MFVTKANKTHLSTEHGIWSQAQVPVLRFGSFNSQDRRFGRIENDGKRPPDRPYRTCPYHVAMAMSIWIKRNTLPISTAADCQIDYHPFRCMHHGSIKSSYIPQHQAPAHFNWNEQRQGPICRLTTSFFLEVCCLSSSWIHSWLKGSLLDTTMVKGCCAERVWSIS